MKIHAICAVAFLMLVAGMGSNAKAAAWCAVYDTSTRNCGFHSFEQCLENIRGIGGYCSRNYYEGGRKRGR